jgi:hypothetical protein
MKAQTLTVLLLVLAIIAISIWISLASDDINRQLQAISEQKESFEPISYAEDNIPIQFVQGTQVPQCQRIQKFPGGGLFCNPSSETDHIDLYSSAEGDLTSTNSSGLNNSRGPLVLNDKMLKLLSTRGNNATGVSNSDLF